MYDLIAPYYDLTHAQLTADLGFVLSLASQAGGKVLELGCGTGRLLLPLARAGFTITGLDSSEAMLALAQQKLAQESEVIRGRVTLVSGDMADLSGCGRDFALVLRGPARDPLARGRAEVGDRDDEVAVVDRLRGPRRD